MSTLAKGDVVRVKSGGPRMTVEKTGQFGGGMSGRSEFQGAVCVWFDGTSVKRESFPIEVLEKDED